MNIEILILNKESDHDRYRKWIDCILVHSHFSGDFFYCILDGFDLGVGVLISFTRKEMDRRVLINSIGPIWDGNEVWLIIVIGALFAGFPSVYTTLLSIFNTPILFLVAALVFRAVSIEFRSKSPSARWRAIWDRFFTGSSALIAFSLGVLLGNLMVGIPMGFNGAYHGDFLLTCIRPYPLLVGLFSFTLFVLHGALFLLLKTEGEQLERIHRWACTLTILFYVIYVLTTWATWYDASHMVVRFSTYPILMVIPGLHLIILTMIPIAMRFRAYGKAFLASCCNILMLTVLFAVGIFPEWIHSNIDPQYSLTLFNTASSVKSLKVLAWIVVIGLPFALAYLTWIYRIFKGKVVLDDHSY